MIHIVNNDALGEQLSKCEPLKGEIFVWREMYDLGPFSSEWDAKEMITRRASFFEDRIGISKAQFEMISYYQEQRFKRIPQTTTITLWFQSHRHDQLMLLYLLNRINQYGLKCVDWVEVPQKEILSEAVLLHQYENRYSLERQHLKHAVTAWKDYISSDPRNIHRWLGTSFSPLPFVFNAFHRHLDYFPQYQNGLNVIEAQALQVISEHTPTFFELYEEIHQLREDDGLSEVHFAAMLNELGKGCAPLICTERGEGITIPDRDRPDRPIMLTSLGESVMAGEKDRIQTCGIDWWLGGVHLTSEGCWRRDSKGCLK